MAFAAALPWPRASHCRVRCSPYHRIHGGYDTFFADADGDFSDWIEIHNPDATPLNLSGYHLTDNSSNLDKWTFPSVTVPPGGYIVVFASSKNRIDPSAQLHTDFLFLSKASSSPSSRPMVQPFSALFRRPFRNTSPTNPSATLPTVSCTISLLLLPRAATAPAGAWVPF